MNRLISANSLNLLPLHSEVEVIFKELAIPPRLYAHSLLVHDVANKLAEAITSTWENLNIDKNSVLFGAAIHEKGHKHEQEGKRLLISLGVPEEKAKFAVTHATWFEKSTIEELIVSLADKVWKGSRIQDLEDLLIEKISTKTKTEHWAIFCLLDSIIEDITKDADKRLSFQNNFSTMCSTTS